MENNFMEAKANIVSNFISASVPRFKEAFDFVTKYKGNEPTNEVKEMVMVYEERMMTTLGLWVSIVGEDFDNVEDALDLFRMFVTSYDFIGMFGVDDINDIDIDY